MEQQVQSVITANEWQGTVTVEEPAATNPPVSGETLNNATSEPTTNTTQAPTDAPTQPTLANGVPANAELQADGTYLLTEQVDLRGDPVPEGSEPAYIHKLHDNAQGDLLRDELLYLETENPYSQTLWEYDEQGNCISYEHTKYSSSGAIRSGSKEEYDSAGRMISQSQYGKNGVPSSATSWSYGEDGSVAKLVASYNDDGVLTEQREVIDGTLISITTFRDDGSTRKTTYIDFTKNILEVEEHYPDGSYSYMYQNPEEDRLHTIIKNPNTSADFISYVSTGLEIEGYSETTSEDGTFFRREWKDGYRYMEVMDGYTNAWGYVYRETIYYYPNGVTKSAETYYYADGGHTYGEFDEEGNPIYHEDTTICDGTESF